MSEGSLFGLAPNDDYPRLEQADGNPAFGENHAFWLFAGDGSVWINVHLNCIEACWPLRRETITICLPDGRVLVEMNEGWGTSADTIASGGMRARCVEPMRRWRLDYKGTMRLTTQAALAHGRLADGEGLRVIVEWEADVVCDAPVFRQGGTDERWAALQASSAAGLIGGARYEQLARAEVRLRVAGEDLGGFAATGTRTHRAGVRRMTEMLRADWQTALFPDGSGFYLSRYRKDDGRIEWEEACVLRDGAVVPARIVSDHWVTRRETAGERFAVRLATDDGVVEIGAEIAGAVFRGISIAGDDPSLKARGPLDRGFGFEDSAYRTLVIQQACARYELGGMTSYGVCERHNYADQFAG